MAEEKMCKSLLVGVSGSIHAIDIYSYLTRFRESLAQNIRVIMTKQASKMVPPQTIKLFTDDRVFINLWDQSATINRAPHIQLTRWADLFIVVPSTADIIGKAANGIADDLLSTAILSSSIPIIFVPVMNTSMWQSKALQRNVKVLEEDGHYIIHPEQNNSAIGIEDQEQSMGSDPETVLLHSKHVLMKRLKEAYWEEATRDKPLTPIEKKRQQLASIKKEALLTKNRETN